MNLESLLKTVDHTCLKQTATWEDIQKLCNEGIEYGVASVCIPPYYVKKAKNYVNNKIKICTVIGFPNGYNTLKTKIFETQDAVKNGADEIDIVINIGLAKSGLFDIINSEIMELKSACEGRILKVIVETCLLTKEEKIKLCKVVTDSGVDFIKTSTGFSNKGATFEDIELFSKYVGDNVRIKAAGGIGTLQDAQKFLDLGASRLGSSKIIKLVKSIK